MALVKSYEGIRGIYGTELTDHDAARFAGAFSAYLKNAYGNYKVVIGRDTRVSGENLSAILSRGLSGEILDVGAMPTAAVENAVRAFQADAGVIITASHNEPEYNGFKFLGKDGALLNPEIMKGIIEEYEKNNVISKSAKSDAIKDVKNANAESLEEYKKFLLSFFSESDLAMMKNAKAVIDPNGGAGISVRVIFDSLGINAQYLNMVPSSFSRKVEPNQESLSYLKSEIAKNKADFAAGFDCDADRVEILLADGTLVSGNHLLALVAGDLLGDFKNSGKETVVVNDATSYLVKEVVEKHNAAWQEVEVGEIMVVDKMAELNSLIGGEGSNGGVIVRPGKCRDGILTLMYILKIIGQSGQSLKQLTEKLPKYFYLKEKVKLSEDFVKIRNRVKEKYKNDGYAIQETGDETGGLKALKNGSWIWFRQSKTEDKVLRIIADSKSEEIAEQYMADAKNLLKLL